MSLVVRQVDLDRDRRSLLAILNRNLPELRHELRFSWRYLDNPCGPTWAWFVHDEHTDRPVGTASVFPRAIWIGDKIAICGQVGDFAIDASHRSLGPALQLQKATFQPANEGKLAFVYDCPPHDKGMSPFRRLGMEANAQMERYVRLLRTERPLMRLLRKPKLGAAAAVIGNAVLALSHRPHARVKGLEIAEMTGDFDAEFTEFDRRVGGSGGIRSRRAREDLNWRYRRNPLQSYRVLVARIGGELAGFVVFLLNGEQAFGIDLFWVGLNNVGLALLDAVAGCVRSRAQVLVTGVAEKYDSLAQVLRAAHFRYRSETAKLVAYAPPANGCQLPLRGSSGWHFQLCDVMA